MADKVFGLDFTDDTNPSGGETVSVYQAGVLKDVTLANLVGASTANAASKATPVDADSITMWDSVASLLKRLTWANLKATLKTYFDTLYQADGKVPDSVRTKYIITPSVASNNLTLAIKYVDGNDPSSTNKIIFRVGDTEYTVSAATSFTKNAATNWCNLGSAILATKDVDLFVYAIGETGASAGIKFGFSRIPHAVTMADFVNTSTDEKYIAGNWTNFNSTDKVTVIGRFRARLSAGAGYTWSIPTAVVLNYPIYTTDWLDGAFVLGATSGSITSYSLTTAKYKVMWHTVDILYDISVTDNGTGAGNLTFTVPFTAANIITGWGRNIGNANTLSVSAGATALAGLLKYDGTYPVATGQSVRGGLTYNI